MKKQLNALLALTFALASAPTAAAPSGGSIAGTLKAPAGLSVKGSVVIACAPVKDGCDDKGSRLLEVKTPGSSVAYSMENVPSGSYTVLAWKDVDGDDEVTDGDLLGFYSKDGKSQTQVRPPAKDVTLQMNVYRDEAAASAAPAQNSSQSSSAASNPTKATPYVMTGVVKDERGKPLAGVEVFADNTLYYDMNALGTTDAQGRYTIKLPQNQPGTWKAGAYVEREYHGEDYKFRLYADNDSAFSTDQGAVRNFTWKVSGKAPGGGYIGALVYVYGDYGNGDFDMEEAEVTLTPSGPIVDGSAGKPITRFVKGGRIEDVPVGRYTATARLKTDGGTRPILVQAKGGKTYGSSATSDFHQSYYGVTMEFNLKLPE